MEIGECGLGHRWLRIKREERRMPRGDARVRKLV